MTSRTDSPSTQLNLDTLKRENAPEPFAFVLGGQRFVCVDPQELDYRVFNENLEDVEAQFRVLLGDAFEKFHAEKLPLWKVQKLNAAMMEHYGLGDTAASMAS